MKISISKLKFIASVSVAWASLNSQDAIAQLVPYFDPRTGHTTYSNVPPTGFEIQATPVEPQAAPQAQQAAVGTLRRAGKPFVAKRIATRGPSDFPAVTAAEQRRRDEDRRSILMDELQHESDALTKAEKSTDQATLARHRQNIESLKREIANLN